MKSIIFSLLLISFFTLVGCSDNPKTKNELLRNKKISWTQDRAEYYEFLADGTLIYIGGDWPAAGYKGRQWESVDENGSFKIIPDPPKPDTFTIARLKNKMAPGVPFTFEHFTGNVSTGIEETQYTIEKHEQIKKSHKKTATAMDARVQLKQYANEEYLLYLSVEDPNGIIKRIPTQGDAITTETMQTNAKQWNIEPPVPVSKGHKPNMPIQSTMTIEYLSGKTETLHFMTTTIKDLSSEVYEDPWF